MNFRNYSNQQPSHSPRFVPVQQRSSPKVISVPVHFVSSDQPRTTISMLKDSAAIKIQKVFRGFVVRKSVKRINSLRNEVGEIERRIEDIEVVNLIRRDAKERLRVNETLMSLLFKLDSIRGVDNGIRDLRKAVTRKAIALQEKVDSIAQIGHQTLDSCEIDLDNSACTSTSEACNSLNEMIDNHVNLEAVEETVKEVVTDSDPVKAVDGIGEVEGMETSPPVNLTESGEEDDTTPDLQKQRKCNSAKYHKENREILQNLMGDNEKMMRLMSQISERNEMQTRMINSLSRRVEQLEKALSTEKMRKKKKTPVFVKGRRDKDGFSI